MIDRMPFRRFWLLKPDITHLLEETPEQTKAWYRANISSIHAHREKVHRERIQQAGG